MDGRNSAQPTQPSQFRWPAENAMHPGAAEPQPTWSAAVPAPAAASEPGRMESVAHSQVHSCCGRDARAPETSRSAGISRGARLCARSTSRSRLATREASDFNGRPRRFGPAAAGPRRTHPPSISCGSAALYYIPAESSRSARIFPTTLAPSLIRHLPIPLPNPAASPRKRPRAPAAKSSVSFCARRTKAARKFHALLPPSALRPGTGRAPWVAAPSHCAHPVSVLLLWGSIA